MIASGQFSLIGVQDATVYEYCYKATSNSGRPATPTSGNTDGALPSGWLREPPDVSAVNAYVWESKRSKTDGLSWGSWSSPVLKNRWANDGFNVIAAETNIREYTYSEWKVYGETGHVENWINISNASMFKPGDTISIPGVCTDRDYITVIIYAKVNSVSGTNVVAATTNIIFGGSKGARMRIRDWATGQQYMQGKDGEDFYDIGVYESKLYLCTKTHTSSSANNPITSVSSYLGYWEIAQDWVFVATRLLLAEKIKADQIDADGITAKDVDITGKITATSGSFTGTVYAQQGQIGGLKISGNSLTNEGFDNDARIVMRNDKKDVFTGIGVNVWPASAPKITALCRLENNQSRSDYKTNIGLYAEASGVPTTGTDSNPDYGNHAIYIPKGDICGFRLRARRITASTTLSLMDSIIFCLNTSDITLTLPSGPEDGQLYLIRKVNLGNILIRGTIQRDYGSGTVNEVQITNRSLYIVMYNKSYGHWTTNSIQPGWD